MLYDSFRSTLSNALEMNIAHKGEIPKTGLVEYHETRLFSSTCQN
jgi:hypothetical protein